jgi:two-component system sensor histidine kinase UhpB
MSLRARVVVLIGLVLIAGVLLGTVLAGYEAKRTLVDELRAAMIGGQQTVVSAFEDLPRSDHALRDLHQLVSTFDGNRHVRAQLTDDHGRVLETSLRPYPSNIAPGWFSRLFGESPPDIVIPAPPPVQGRAIVLQTIADVDLSALWSEFLVVLAAIGLSVIGGLVLVYLAIGAALRPLGDVADGFARVGGGDYRMRLRPVGPSDLIVLQRGFNDMVDRLTLMDRRNRALEAQLVTLQEEERADLARDLHDEIGPHLFAVNVDAQIIGQLVGADPKTPVTEHIHSIQSSIGHMQRLVREMLGRLRPSRATELGLHPAIVDLVAFWRARSPAIDIRYEALEDESILEEQAKDTVYRIVQESLNNAARHAGASRIVVRIARLGEAEVEVSISDDGASAAPVNQGGFGIIGMRERVRNSGGALAIDERGADGGWSVIARLPCKGPPPAADAEVDR